MKKTSILSIALFGGICSSAFATNNQIGIEFFKFGAIEQAKEIFLSDKKIGNINAETDYYLGEIYFSQQKLDSASFYFNDGLAKQPEDALNKIGIAKLNLTKSPKESNAILKKIGDKNKKNPSILIAIGKAYLDNNQSEKALQYAHMAKKIKNAGGYVLEGDIYASKNELGKASGSYEQALTFDKSCKEAYVRYANVYMSVNPDLSANILERLIEVDPTSPFAQRAVADAYYAGGQFRKAADAYSKYATSEYCVPSDLSKYALILFYSGDYQKSWEIVSSSLKTNPNDFVMKRLLMYNDYELKKYVEGLPAADNFMNNKADNQKFIYLDYVYYGRFLQKSENYNKALEQYQKSIELDSTKIIAYKELASTFESLNNYELAIKNYQLYIYKSGDKATFGDQLALGKNYYYAGNAIQVKDKPNLEKRKQLLLAADSIFGYVAGKSTNSYLGNFWRARANSSLDPETEKGLAKPYYEAALELLEKNAQNNVKQIVECYSYLGYYFYVKGEKQTSISYWNKILKIDPTNEVAKTALAGM